MRSSSQLHRYLKDRSTISRFTEEEWSLLFSEARRSGVLHRLAVELECGTEELGSVPFRLHGHVRSSSLQSVAFRIDVVRELQFIKSALAKLDAPVILLKGASYVLLDLPSASGRTFGDVDILVPKKQIPSAEALLMIGGWSVGQIDAYDDRYYREWSHEIPPMTHLRRGTTIDLHHSLVMPTCRVHVASDMMVNEAIPVSGQDLWWRLRDEDILLHAISHLILNSEFDRGLRDLWDIDLLFRHYCSCSPAFPERLASRANEVGLGELTLQALALASRFFCTPLLPPFSSKHESVVSKLIAIASSTRHTATRPRWQGVADVILAFREMYLRLPGRFLVRHLTHKAGFGRSHSAE